MFLLRTVELTLFLYVKVCVLQFATANMAGKTAYFIMDHGASGTKQNGAVISILKREKMNSSEGIPFFPAEKFQWKRISHRNNRVFSTNGKRPCLQSLSTINLVPRVSPISTSTQRGVKRRDPGNEVCLPHALRIICPYSSYSEAL